MKEQPMTNQKCDRKPRPARAGRICCKIALAILLPLTATLSSGCLIAAAVAATVVIIQSTSTHTATVEVPKTPDEVYRAMLRVVDESPDVKIDRREDHKRHLKLIRGKNFAEAHVKSCKEGGALLTVVGTAWEKGETHKDFALEIVERICTELGVKYKIIEKKGILSPKKKSEKKP